LISKSEKLVKKFLSNPLDFTWDELLKLLSHFGYAEMKTGKTGVSRRKFIDTKNQIISLHRPHPGNTLKRYQIEQLKETLTEQGKLNYD
jgi:hypothetical protein